MVTWSAFRRVIEGNCGSCTARRHRIHSISEACGTTRCPIPCRRSVSQHGRPAIGEYEATIQFDISRRFARAGSVDALLVDERTG